MTGFLHQLIPKWDFFRLFLFRFAFNFTRRAVGSFDLRNLITLEIICLHTSCYVLVWYFSLEFNVTVSLHHRAAEWQLAAGINYWKQGMKKFFSYWPHTFRYWFNFPEISRGFQIIWCKQAEEFEQKSTFQCWRFTT